MKKATITEEGKPAFLDTDTGEITELTPKYVSIIEAHFAPNWKTPYNHDTKAEADATATICTSPSKTQQQFAKDADINAILAKFLNTGELPITGQPTYMDIEGEFDLMDKMVTGHQVEEAWNALPEITRELLGNPQRFTAYVEDKLAKGDLAALRKVGLVPEPKPPQTDSGAPKAATGDTPAPDDAKPGSAPADPVT